MAQTRYRRGTHPNSLANLAPPIQPGEVRNPKGRSAKVFYPSEWMRIMTGWKVAQLDAVLDDPKAPAGKLIAARQVRLAVETGADIPIAVVGDSADRVMDRTEGRPIQKTQVQIHDDRDLETQIDAFFVRIRRLSPALAGRSGADGAGGADLPAGSDRAELDSQ